MRTICEGMPPPAALVKFRPIPRPAPVRTEAPTEGAIRSSRLKVALATRPRRTTSPTLVRFPLMAYAATATTRPSKKYFRRRVTNSRTSKE
jgi:hypothetical protein